MRWTVQEIVKVTGGTLLRGDPARFVERFSTDSRTLEPGEWFVPLRGERFNGHDFLEAALDRGAVGAFAAHEEASARRDVLNRYPHAILVDDPLEALIALARSARSAFSGPVVGITGSNGKTTAKEFTAAVLGPEALKAPASFNNRIGVARTLIALSPQSHRFVVCELGTNHPGEIAELVKIVQPTIGVFLNVGPVHLEFFKDEEAIAEEKSCLPKSSEWAVLNADDPRVIRYAPECRNVLTFGRSEGAEVRAGLVTLDELGRPTFELIVRGDRVGRVGLRANGAHHVVNALAAAAVGVLCGVPGEALLQRLADAEPPPMRTQRLTLHGVEWIHDAYNANLPSVRAALELFRRVPAAGRRWVILGEMAELGAAAEDHHRAAAGALSPDWCDVFVAVGPYADAMAQAAQKAGVLAIFRFPTVEEVCESLPEMLAPGDLVLLKGSRRARMERIVERFACEGGAITLKAP
ncbi:MAG: UDP-N-acetylmuramoyl-tripeptide--D-alanyl-D-alanine ligase [Candidatus Poribacteria bacterium]|nr:MAG: UDP-N-acetylmuramoyl-tripeptide--D-alanyl-D-alanine ligase [Candidatus Poribacteria bacterium]